MAIGQNIIDVSFDIPKFDEGKQHIYEGLMQLYDLIKKSPPKVDIASGGGWAEIKKNLADLPGYMKAVEDGFTKVNTAQKEAATAATRTAAAIKAQTSDTALANVQTAERNRQLKIQATLENTVAGSLEQSKAKIKDLEYQLEILNTTTEKGTQKKQQLIQAIAEEKTQQLGLAEAQRQATAIIKDQVQSMAAVANAAQVGGETVEILRLKLQALTKDRDTKVNILDPVALKKANDQVAAVKAQLDKIEQGGGNFRGNVGNYTNAINILKESLVDATARLQQMTQAGQLNTEAGQRTAAEVQELTILVGQQSHGFISLTREVMNMGKALETMHEQGLGTTQAFQKLETEFGNAKRRLTEFRNEQKLVTDTAPKIAALTAAAKGLGGAYAAGAGAAALFASDNEHIEKELNKLVAVMTLLQGLHELHTLAVEKDGIMTVLFGKGMQAAAAETTGFGKALAFIEANPIVIALTALAAIVLVLVANYKSEEEQLKETTEAEIAYTDSLKNQTDNILALNKLKNEKLFLDKKDLENQLALLQHQGGDPEKELLLKKQIAAVNKQISDSDARAVPAAERKIKLEETALDTLRAQKAEQDKVVARLADLNKDNLKGNKKTFIDAHDSYYNINYRKFVDVKDELKKQQDIQKLQEDAIKSREANVAQLKSVDEAQKESNQKSLEQQADEQKFYSDEARKLMLANAQQEITATQAKNALILANERSTFEQRLAAMESNADAQKRLAKAMEINETRTPGKTDNDKAIARQGYRKKIEEIDAASNAEIEKAIIDHNDKEIAAIHLVNKLRLEADAATRDALAKDEQADLDNRLNALKKGVADRTQVIRQEYEDKVRLAKEHAPTDEMGKQILLATAERDKALEELTASTQKNIYDTTVSWGEKRVKAVEDLNKTINASGAVTARYNDDVRALEDNLLKKQISYRKYIADRQALDRAYMVAKDQADVADAEKELQNTKDLIADELQVKLNAANINLSAAKIGGNKDKVAEAQKEVDALYAVKQKAVADEVKQTDDLNNKKKKSNEDRIALEDKADKAKKANEKQLAQESFNFAKTLVDAGYENKINAIEEEIKATDEQAQNEIAAIQASTLSKQDQAAEITILTAQQKTKDTQLKNQEKQEKVKQAKADRDFAVAQTVWNTASAIIATLAEYKGTPYGFGVAATIAALGAVEVATILAKPIPTYAAGLDSAPSDHYGVYGEAGAELIEKPGQTPYVADSATLDYIPRGTKITPLSTAEINDAMYGSMVHSMAERFMLADIAERKRNNNSEGIVTAINLQTRQITKALSKNQGKQKVIVKMPVEMRGLDTEYLNTKIYGNK